MLLKRCLQVQSQVGVTQGTRQLLILLYWDCVPKHCTWPAGPAYSQLLWMKRYLRNAKPSKHCLFSCVYGNYQRLKNETEAKMRKKRCPAGARGREWEYARSHSSDASLKVKETTESTSLAPESRELRWAQWALRFISVTWLFRTGRFLKNRFSKTIKQFLTSHHVIVSSSGPWHPIR